MDKIEEVDALKMENFRLKLAQIEAAYSKAKEAADAHSRHMAQKYQLAATDQINTETHAIIRVEPIKAVE